IWRRADRALALHPDDPAAVERCALIAVALGEPERADSLAARVLRGRGPDVVAWLLRAEASFQLGRDTTGYAWYDSALAHADLDSSGALWDNVRLIATPDEAARFAATGPGDARRFFLWFWGKRDPNLVTPWNERIAEHFRRLAYARRHFHLLHPLSLYHRSATARGLAAAGLRSLQRQFVAIEPQLVPVASERLALAAGLGPEPPADAGAPGRGRAAPARNRPHAAGRAAQPPRVGGVLSRPHAGPHGGLLPQRARHGGRRSVGRARRGRGAGRRPGAVARQRSAGTLRLRTRRRFGRRAGPDPRRGAGPH